MFLESKSAILFEQLQPRLLEGKREACEIMFSDFDDVAFKISSSPDSPNIIRVNMAMRNAVELKALGSQEVLDRLFPGMESSPEAGYDLAIEFDCNSIPNPLEFLATVSDLKRHMSSGPLDRAFTALNENRSSSVPIMMTNYRKTEVMFVCPAASKVVVIFLVDFSDATDKALARVFLQEFVEAQRTVRTAPPVSYSRGTGMLI